MKRFSIIGDYMSYEELVVNNINVEFQTEVESGDLEIIVENEINEKDYDIGVVYSSALVVSKLHDGAIPEFKLGMKSKLLGVKEVGKLIIEQDWLVVNKEKQSAQCYKKYYLTGDMVQVYEDKLGNKFIKTIWGLKNEVFNINLTAIPVTFQLK